MRIPICAWYIVISREIVSFLIKSVELVLLCLWLSRMFQCKFRQRGQ